MMLALHLALFAIPATIAWTSTLDSTFMLPLLGLAATLIAGVTMLVDAGWRRAGAAILIATVVAALAEAGLAVLLIGLYSEANPGWDLS
jgi:hypothetical protein